MVFQPARSCSEHYHPNAQITCLRFKHTLPQAEKAKFLLATEGWRGYPGYVALFTTRVPGRLLLLLLLLLLMLMPRKVVGKKEEECCESYEGSHPAFLP